MTAIEELEKALEHLVKAQESSPRRKSRTLNQRTLELHAIWLETAIDRIRRVKQEKEGILELLQQEKEE